MSKTDGLFSYPSLCAYNLYTSQIFVHVLTSGQMAFYASMTPLAGFFLQQKKSLETKGFLLRKMGLEPTRHCCHKILSLARLPVPTLPHFCRPGNTPNNRIDYITKNSFRQQLFYSTRKAVTGSLLAAFLEGSSPLIRVRTMLSVTSTAAPAGGKLPLISSVFAK